MARPSITSLLLRDSPLLRYPLFFLPDLDGEREDSRCFIGRRDGPDVEVVALNVKAKNQIRQLLAIPTP